MLYTKKTRSDLWNPAAWLENRWVGIYENSPSVLTVCVCPPAWSALCGPSSLTGVNAGQACRIRRSSRRALRQQCGLLQGGTGASGISVDVDVSYPSLQLPQPCVAISNLRVILTSRVRDDDEGRCAMRRRRSMQLPEGFVRPQIWCAASRRPR